MTSFQRPIVDAWMDEQEIIWLRFKEIGRHGIEEAKDVVDAHEQISGPVKARVLADLRGVRTGADRHARAYYISERGARYKLCMAMLVDSPLQSIIGNIFIRVSRPPYPTKLFTNEEEARAWLLSFAKESAAPNQADVKSCSLADVWQEPRDVVRVEMKASETHGPQEAKELQAFASAFNQGNKQRVLADLRAMVTSPDREARALYGKSRFRRWILCIALLTSSELQAQAGNFFINIVKPAYPVKIFTSQAEAERWMHSFEDEVAA